MCTHFAPGRPEGCDEEGAEEVRNKEAANFCDWFEPDPQAFDGRDRRADEAARQQLDALFGQATPTPAGAADADSAQAAAEDLFRK